MGPQGGKLHPPCLWPRGGDTGTCKILKEFGRVWDSSQRWIQNLVGSNWNIVKSGKLYNQDRRGIQKGLGQMPNSWFSMNSGRWNIEKKWQSLGFLKILDKTGQSARRANAGFFLRQACKWGSCSQEKEIGHGWILGKPVELRKD